MFAPEIECAIARHGRRVVLVANNPELPATVLEALCLGAGDVVIQFNNALHEAALLDAPCLHVRLHRAHRPKSGHGFHYGFPPSPELVRAALAAPERHLLVLSGAAPALHHSGVALADLFFPASLGARLARFDERTDYGDLPHYPRPAGVEHADPSTGFWTVAALLDLRRRLWAQGADGFDLVLAGFGRASQGLFWEGHDWDYERAWLARAAGQGLLRIVGVAPPAQRFAPQVKVEATA